MMHKPYGPYEKYFKRPLDLLCALAVIALFWWLYAIVAILVRVNLGSPVLFKQDRPGKDGNIFRLYKFRTMTDSRDEDGNLLPDDLRLTRFGRLLRSTSLDEIPEVFNIIKGDMSIIGPRPLLVEYLPYYKSEELHRHDVRPGLTGWAQVNGRNAIGSWEERFEYDLEYVNHCSFMMDMRILFLTIYKVLKKSDIQVGSEIKAGRLDVARSISVNKISIRRFEKTDIPAKVGWVNNPENNRFLHYDIPIEIEKTERWFDSISGRTDRYDGIIECAGTPVGLIGLLSIDKVNGKAEYYILLGDTRYKGKGIAKEASRQIIDYGFQSLGLNRIYLFTEVDNTTAQGLFEKVGFTKEGHLRQDIFSHGRPADRFVYGILKEDWNKDKSNGKDCHPDSGRI